MEALSVSTTKSVSDVLTIITVISIATLHLWPKVDHNLGLIDIADDIDLGTKVVEIMYY